MIRNEFANAIA